ncbi:hypothetical protein WMZ97_00390 [Lentibacillus sp. N15]|uniref:hypothetical protein n=1 Tax=Lentibacillus songyuanensis TaxID=3136161 RepID=UPI0031B9D31E
MEYIGDNEIPKKIKYDIKQGLKTTDGQDNLKKGILKVNSPIDHKHKDEINVQITWNGKFETIELVKKIKLRKIILKRGSQFEQEKSNF